MAAPGYSDRETWPLWEVFVRASRGLSHVHAGSLHAPDAELALRNARDLYTRRGEGTSVWVVPADAITTSDPGMPATAASVAPTFVPFESST